LITLLPRIVTATAPLIVWLSLDFAGPTAILHLTTALALAVTLVRLALRAPQGLVSGPI
jgi:hypothetical protein